MDNVSWVKLHCTRTAKPNRETESRDSAGMPIQLLRINPLIAKLIARFYSTAVTAHEIDLFENRLITSQGSRLPPSVRF